MSDYIYPFDPTGKAVSNLIQNERQTISPPNWTDFYFVIPKMAPYFRDSLRVVHRPSGKILVEGQDYHCTHFFHDASFGTANRIYGSITLLDKTLTGLLEFEYQTLGGEWVIDEDLAAEILSNTLMNPRITTWEQVVEMPYAFPPIDHEWDLENLRNMDDVVNSINQIAELMEQNSDDTVANHIANRENPHQVTKAQVGLSQVQNLPLSTYDAVLAADSNAHYMTPLRVKQLLDTHLTPIVNSHLTNVSNPHNTTKAQVGLSLVQNFGLSRKEDAEDGVSNTLYMTPLRTKEAINHFKTSVFDAHALDQSNPHRVNKAQVGLGAVENLPLANSTVVEEAISDAHYMTPLRTSQMINLLVKDTLDSHINNYGNPHQVNKSQIGLGSVDDFATATEQEAIEGELNDRFMTPLRTRQLVDTKITELESSTGASDELLSQHVSNFENPHGVTAAQLGVYNANEVDALLSFKLGLDDTAANSALLEGLTLGDVDELITRVNRFNSTDQGTADGLVTWSLVAETEYVTTNVNNSLTAIVTAFNDLGDGTTVRSAIGILNVSPYGAESVINVVDGDPVDNEFYFRIINKDIGDGVVELVDMLEIWLKQTGRRNPVTITSLDDITEPWDDHTGPATTTEPSGLTPISYRYLAYRSDLESLNNNLSTINGGTF